MSEEYCFITSKKNKKIRIKEKRRMNKVYFINSLKVYEQSILYIFQAGLPTSCQLFSFQHLASLTGNLHSRKKTSSTLFL